MDDISQTEQEVIDATDVRDDSRMLTEKFERGEAPKVVSYDEATRTAELSFASEYPVDRWYGMEILEMSPRAADLSRLNSGASSLVSQHTGQRLGGIKKAWIGEDKRAHAIVQFSKRAAAQDEFQDIIDGCPAPVSFGYRVLDYNTEKGVGRTPDKRTVTKWQAFEISLVAVPADPNVGVGRAQEDLGNPAPIEQVEITESREAVTAALAENKERSNQTMDENTQATGQPAATVTFAREDSILAYGQRFGADINLTRSIANDPNGTVDMLREKLSEQFRAVVATPAAPAERPATELNLTDKEKRNYSISRAIIAQADGDWKNAGLERECHEAIATKLGRESSGFFVPSDVQNDADITARDLSATGGASSGGAIVASNLMPQSFIDLLRSKALMLSEAGVTVMSDLVGNPSIPRQDGAATGYWVAEGVAPNESQLVLGQLAMSPKTCGALTEFTRQLLIQSTPSIDQLVKSDIAAVLARTIDSAIIQGTGSAGQPTGILNTTGVSEVSMLGAAFSFDDAVAFETAIAEANAPEGVRWVMRPSVRGALKSRPKIGTTYPVYLIEDDQLNGYEVDATTQMPVSTLIFGDFSTVILGEWGILEIEANKYGSSFGHGGIQVRGLHMVDVAVRYPQALKKLTAFA